MVNHTSPYITLPSISMLLVAAVSPQRVAVASPIPKSSHSVLSSMTVRRSQAKIWGDASSGTRKSHCLGFGISGSEHPENVKTHGH